MNISIQRLWAMFKARNHEFFRDRAAFGWNFVFPFLLIAGFGILFGGKAISEYKVGVFPLPQPAAEQPLDPETLALPQGFAQTRYLKFIGLASAQQGLAKLRHHKIDFLLRLGPPPNRYWVNDASPRSYIVERMFVASLERNPQGRAAARAAVMGGPIRYIDWLFPGILGMNMMFSALWGVGYVVVRYRKNGALKRLHATPLSAFEYLGAQMLSRIFLLMFTLVVVWGGCDLIFDFRVEGSYVALFAVFFAGSLSLTALGLILAARGTSEELATGLLNFISWPMMFLSEVWFSLEGAPAWVQHVARVFPLDHMLRAARAVMHDGAGLPQVAPAIGILGLMTLGFLAIAAALFSWDR
jgi:ABC-type multidrug transport system permease subunit